MTKIQQPLWLLAELTYRCPLQCPYCSNPLEFAQIKQELSTQQWCDVFTQAREMGAVQLGFSGGEPLVRTDLEQLIQHAHTLGFYTNLITSGIGLTENKLKQFKQAGLDHIQISFQANDPLVNDALAGSKHAFEQKYKMAQLVKKYDYPMVLNFVIHRHNIHEIDKMIELSLALKADSVELAVCQFYGWAKLNIDGLLPTQEQLTTAERITKQYREKLAQINSTCTLIFVIPDYYETRPKPCMNGWGNIFLTVAPDGMALPCHAARQLPIEFPFVQNTTLKDIWNHSKGFNYFRGDAWMPEPCQSCDEKEKDHGGCRCQAFLLTGHAEYTDPVCSKSPQHHLIHDTQKKTSQAFSLDQLIARNSRNSKKYIPIFHQD